MTDSQRVPWTAFTILAMCLDTLYLPGVPDVNNVFILTWFAQNKRYKMCVLQKVQNVVSFASWGKEQHKWQDERPIFSIHQK